MSYNSYGAMWKGILVGTALVAMTLAALVQATPGSQFATTVLQRSITDTQIEIVVGPPARVHSYDDDDDEDNGPVLHDILVQQVTAQPGGYSGWHSHPGPGLVAVKAGVVAIYSGDDETCAPKYVAAGSAFVEEAGHVHFVRNEGTVPYEAYATFVLPVGVPGRTDESNPGNCPF